MELFSGQVIKDANYFTVVVDYNMCRVKLVSGVGWPVCCTSDASFVLEVPVEFVALDRSRLRGTPFWKGTLLAFVPLSPSSPHYSVMACVTDATK